MQIHHDHIIICDNNIVIVSTLLLGKIREPTSIKFELSALFYWCALSNYYMDITCSFHQTLGATDRQSEFETLYYYMKNFCKLIVLEQWYFSLI